MRVAQQGRPLPSWVENRALALHLLQVFGRMRDYACRTTVMLAKVSPQVAAPGRSARLHASARTTLDTYGHLWPDSDDSTRAAIGAVMAAREGSSRAADPG